MASTIRGITGIRAQDGVGCHSRDGVQLLGPSQAWVWVLRPYAVSWKGWRGRLATYLWCVQSLGSVAGGPRSMAPTSPQPEATRTHPAISEAPGLSLVDHCFHSHTSRGCFPSLGLPGAPTLAADPSHRPDGVPSLLAEKLASLAFFP